MNVRQPRWVVVAGVVLAPVLAGAWLAGHDRSPGPGAVTCPGGRPAVGDGGPSSLVGAIPRPWDLDPLLQAAASGEVEVVERLLGEGADPGAKSGGGWTALHMAAVFGHPDVAILLLEAGADPRAATDLLTTPLHCAGRRGDLELITLLVEHGADPNAVSGVGQTPLHLVAARGSADCVRALLALGVEVNPKDANGCTPLDLALTCKTPEAANVLRARGGCRSKDVPTGRPEPGRH